MSVMKVTNPASEVLVMSSREIAELTGKEHRNVMRDIRNMLEQLGEGVLRFEQTYRDPQNGQLYPCFMLPKDLTLTLVSGYNVRLRHRIVNRWMELEQQNSRPSLPDFTNPAEAARAFADQWEKNQALLLENRKVAAERDGMKEMVGVYTHTINRVVRMLPGVNTMATKRDLQRLGYLYRHFGHYRVYSQYQHLFVEKFDEETGRGNLYCTPEGKALLARLYEEGGLTLKVGAKVKVYE